MKKIPLFLATILLLASSISQAEQALSKELITSFQQLSNQWPSLEADYPELSSSLDGLDMFQVEKATVTLKNSAAYPRIKTMLTKLAEMNKNMLMMKRAMANTSAADKKFISDNAQWVMSTLGEE